MRLYNVSFQKFLNFEKQNIDLNSSIEIKYCIHNNDIYSNNVHVMSKYRFLNSENHIKFLKMTFRQLKSSIKNKLCHDIETNPGPPIIYKPQLIMLIILITFLCSMSTLCYHKQEKINHSASTNKNTIYVDNIEVKHADISQYYYLQQKRFLSV